MVLGPHPLSSSPPEGGVLTRPSALVSAFLLQHGGFFLFFKPSGKKEGEGARKERRKFFPLIPATCSRNKRRKLKAATLTQAPVLTWCILT